MKRLFIFMAFVAIEGTLIPIQNIGMVFKMRFNNVTLPGPQNRQQPQIDIEMVQNISPRPRGRPEGPVRRSVVCNYVYITGSSLPCSLTIS